MYIGYLMTDYEIFTYGETQEEVKERIVKGYKDFFGINERMFENPTFDDLNDYFGCWIMKINEKGYAHP